jgi:hypothetical protein
MGTRVKIGRQKTIYFLLVLFLVSCGGEKTESVGKYHDHPRLAQSPWPIIHANPAQQASVKFSGPNPPLKIELFDYKGPGWILFDSKKNILFGASVATERKHEFKKFDKSMKLIAEFSLSFQGATGIFGGIYSFVDHEDCIWTSIDVSIYRICEKGGRFEESMKFDLSEISDGFSKDETILALMPLYKPAGFIDIAFVTLGFEYEKEGDFLKINIPGAKLGIIQVFDKNKANVYYYQFKGEAIQNSIAIDKKDNIYVITHKKLYKVRFDSSSKSFRIIWDYSYDPGPPPDNIECPAGSSPYSCVLTNLLRKVRFLAGSGTTPTLMGDNEEYIGFADGALPMRIVVLRTEDRSPVEIDNPFPFSYDQNSQTENTLAYFGGKFIVDNNNPEGTGVACYKIEGSYKNEKVKLLWVNREVFAPNNVPLVSGKSQAGYVYELIKQDGKEKWYLTSIDLNTGKVLWRVFIGEGLIHNSMYAPLNLDDEGNIYIGLFGKILRVKGN